MHNLPRISLVVSCYQRPQRTIRMINCIGNQTINNFEVFLIGDGCPYFQQILESREYQLWVERMEKLGNRVITFNMDKNYGGCGYKIINYAIENATGQYFVFAANDDVIEPDHLEHYLSEIEDTDYDMVCYSTLVRPEADRVRVPRLAFSGIGHSEIVVKTTIAQSMPPHGPEYGHDWSFISSIINSGANIKVANNMLKQTYHIMSVGPDKNRVDGYMD